MSHSHPRRAAVALLGCALVLTGASAPGDASSAPAASARVIKQAQVGKATIGMTVAQAVATGQFNKNVSNPPCGVIRLQPKAPWKHQYVVFVHRGKIVEMDVGGRRPHAPNGVHVGSTYRQVKRAYGARLSAPSETGYSQWGAYVHTGAPGAQRRWIGFLFGDALVDDGPVHAGDQVTLVGVTKGARPPLQLDGC